MREHFLRGLKLRGMSASFSGRSWWQQLELQWRHAFAEAYRKQDAEPSEEEFLSFFSAPAIRFAGPTAPFPNMNFELTNLSGITAFTQLQILVVTHQQLETITEVSELTGLTDLFLIGNRIESLEGIERLTRLERLYVQENKIDSLLPIKDLINLKELHVNNNCLSSLDGLTEAHADKLEVFYCKNNPALKRKEILAVERELGIRCRDC